MGQGTSLEQGTLPAAEMAAADKAEKTEKASLWLRAATLASEMATAERVAATRAEVAAWEFKRQFEKARAAQEVPTDGRHTHVPCA